MFDPSSRRPAAGNEDEPSDRCPLCAGPIEESPYPRHRLTLVDESDEAANRRVERRLCPECWEGVRHDLRGRV
jgi:hypothetical protein